MGMIEDDMSMQDTAAADGLVKILGKIAWGEIRRVGRIFRIVMARAFRGPLWQGARSARKNAAAASEDDPISVDQSAQDGATTADQGSADDVDKAKDVSPSMLEKWQRRFYAKQGAREQRRRKLWQEKEHDERLQPSIDPDRQPKNGQPEQLEFEFSASVADAPAATEASQANEVARADLPAPVLQQPYQLPPLELLVHGDDVAGCDDAEITATGKQIQDTLDSFSIDADVGSAIRGPRVTLYQVHVARGVRVSAVSAIANNLAMAVSAPSLRILAPVPGEDYVGVEVPNRQADIVRGGTFLAGKSWQSFQGQLPIIMGRNIQGADVVLDLARAPHLLVAGATGSGKSVCLNSIILSLLYRFSPDELRLMLVDPKVVEMSVYRGLPHLLVPVITDVQLVVLALRWLTQEMERRYRVLAKVGVRNLETFNRRPPPSGEPPVDEEGNPIPAKMPYIVLIIDELADIMLTCRTEVETGLARIAQMSRAVGIHAIVATQRPSVNIITGVIKANFPTRIAFQVSSQVDSRTIIDGKGAESLLGAGDMLFKPPTASRLQRLQGTMVTDAEIERVVRYCSAQGDTAQNFDLLKTAADAVSPTEAEDFEEDDDGFDNGNDSLLRAAMEIVIRDQKASISYIQRRLRIGYNKAATLMEQLEKRGVVGPQVGMLPREILVDSMESAVDDEDY